MPIAPLHPRCAFYARRPGETATAAARRILARLPHKTPDDAKVAERALPEGYEATITRDGATLQTRRVVMDPAGGRVVVDAYCRKLGGASVSTRRCATFTWTLEGEAASWVTRKTISP
jgi:hypothetical protein